MIKRIALLAALCFPLLLQGQDNKWRFYPSLGVDMGGAVPYPLSDIPDGSKGTPKLFPGLGLGAGYSLSEKWDLSFEINYHILSFSASADVRSQKFYFNDHQDIIYFSGHTDTDVELRFVEFPIIAGYSINPTWTFTSGLYYSRILEGSFLTNGSDGITSVDKTITDNAQLPGIAKANSDFSNDLDHWDAGLLFGFRYDMNPKVCFWGRMNVGFKSIFKKEFDNIEYEMYQIRFNAGVSLNLFNK